MAWLAMPQRTGPSIAEPKRSTMKETPDELRAVVAAAMEQLGPAVASTWTCRFEANRARLSGPGPRFSVRDKDGYFTITYEYAPGEQTTRIYDHDETVRFLLKLFRRPAVSGR